MSEIFVQSLRSKNGLHSRHKAEIDRIMAGFPARRSALLPILWIIQREDGWISADSMEEAAQLCGVTAAEVMEVVSFYPMYNRAPVGKYIFGICATLPCALSGADGLYDYLREKLGIGWDETTPDGLFTIQRRECMGACSEAPVMLVNDVLEVRLTRAKVDRIIEECREGARKGFYSGRKELK
jgi:NADH-quinone oxidoreductase subunit E